MNKLKIIVNPISGRGAGGASIPLIEKSLHDKGVAFELVQTERPWHAAELAQAAAQEGFDVVVAAGGDGTANEVLNGLMLAKVEGAQHVPAMGILSVGRGNDFAHGMGVHKPLEEGCQVLAAGRRHVMDVGRMTGGLFPQGRYFGNGVGVGFDAVVGFEALKLKWLTGFPSYIVATLKTVFLYFDAPLVRVDYDDKTLKLPALMVSTMNGRRLGGGFFMAPEGKPDDGLFDICIARQVGRARVFTLVPHFMKGTQATQPEITMLQARRVVITAERGVLPAHIDGETASLEGKQITLELLPRQMEFLTPYGATA